MAKYDDLSRYSYFNTAIKGIELNVGWLGGGTDFPKWEADKVFLQKLWRFFEWEFNSSRGIFLCELPGCEHRLESGCGVEVFVGKHLLLLGTAEIRIFGAHDKVYAAPDLIYHYVEKHGYKPPDEFVEAVLNGPYPADSRFQGMADSFGLKWRTRSDWSSLIRTGRNSGSQ